jgi:hypothetical protein
LIEGSDRSRLRYLYRPEGLGQKVQLEVRQKDGGSNMWHGTVEARGIEVSVGIVEVSDNGMVTQTLGFSNPTKCGLRFFVFENKRLNRKKLEYVAEKLDDTAVEVSRLWLDDTPKAIELMKTKIEDVRSWLEA